MSVRRAAVRIPVDGSGNQIGPAQESAGFLRIILPRPISPTEPAEDLSGDNVPITPYMDIGDNHSEDTINDFLGRRAASISESTAVADDMAASRITSRRRAPSIHGSEGSADGSSRKSVV